MSGESDPSPIAAEKSERAERPRTFPCKGCGANLSFDIEARQLKCPYCGHEQDLGLDPERSVGERDLLAELEKEAERRQEGRSPSTRRLVRCQDCGGETTFEGTLTSQTCPYCAAPIHVRDAHRAEDRVGVDGVLPFSVTDSKALEVFTGWVRSRWFAPTRFKDLGVQGAFQGVYLPFWTFDALTSTAYRGERGDHYWVTVQRGKETVQERRTRWTSAVGSFRRFFDDILVRGTEGNENSLPGKLLDRLDPWPLEACLPFTDAALAGFLARTYDVDLSAAFALGKSEMEALIRTEVRDRIGGDEQRIHSVRSDFAALTFKHLLLPVWLRTYRYGGKPYRVMVNGATGEVCGERPYSIWKILGLIAGIAAVVTAIILATR